MALSEAFFVRSPTALPYASLAKGASARCRASSFRACSMAFWAIILAFACLLVRTASAAEIPDPVATPGALNPAVTQENIDRTICLRGWTRAMRPPESYTERIKRDQLYSPTSPYYAPETRLREWGEDHRVPLSVGGDPYDQKNLWPEPRAGEGNAEKKDQLEERIHNLVCRHVLTLAQGQRVFLGDWREGYRRYVLEREQ